MTSYGAGGRQKDTMQSTKKLDCPRHNPVKINPARRPILVNAKTMMYSKVIVWHNTLK